MKRILLIVLLCYCCTGKLCAQHEFYNKGALVYIQQNGTNADGGYASGTMPTLFVGGSITNTSNGIGQIGDIQNVGEIQVSGDWTQNSNATLQSTGDEVFLGANTGIIDATYNKYTQRITGDATGFIGVNADFYNLLIVKPARTTSNASIVELGTNVEVDRSIKWLGTGGVIRTDIATHNDAGEAYTFEIYLKDTTLLPIANLAGYNTALGSTDKYVEGKLRRQVKSTAASGTTYYFPVGVDPTHAIGGLNAFELKFNNAPTNSGLLGYLEKSNLYAIGNSGVMFCDVGKDPTPAVDDPFNLCAGAPDGVMDKMTATKHQAYQWSVTPNVAGTFNNYEIEVFPTANCELSALGDAVPSACGTGAGTYNGLRMEWLAHNGVPGGTPTAAGSGSPFLGTGYLICPVSNYKRISAQNGFSKFRLHGVTLPNSILPVELISFWGNPIEDYNKINWETASEQNTKWHIVERSDGSSAFSEIGRKPAAGFSNRILNYTLLDEAPLPMSYYRLRTVDLDGKEQLSNTILIKRQIPNVFALQSVYPNPVNETVNIDFTTPSSQPVTLRMYDELGKLVTDKVIQTNTGINHTQIDLTNFASSMLVFVLDNGSEKIYRKIIKLK